MQFDRGSSVRMVILSLLPKVICRGRGHYRATGGKIDAGPFRRRGRLSACFRWKHAEHSFLEKVLYKNWQQNSSSVDARETHDVYRDDQGLPRDILKSLSLLSDGKEIHLEIISKLSDIGYQIGEISADLSWEPGRKKRKSGFQARRYILSHLAFGIGESPLFFLSLISLFFVVLGCSGGIYLLALSLSGNPVAGRPLIQFVMLAIIVGLFMLIFGFSPSRIDTWNDRCCGCTTKSSKTEPSRKKAKMSDIDRDEALSHEQIHHQENHLRNRQRLSELYGKVARQQNELIIEYCKGKSVLDVGAGYGNLTRQLIDSGGKLSLLKLMKRK